MENGSFVITGTFGNTSFTEAVESPTIGLARLMNGERVESATTDVDDVFRKTKLTWLKTVQFVALNYAATELILLS